MAAMALAGCAGSTGMPEGPDCIFFAPGVAGDGPWYAALRRGLRDGGVTDAPHTVSWGLPPPLTTFNFQTPSIHNGAEEKLARLIASFRQQHPGGRLRLLSHSAGGGVVLGALAKLDSSVEVDQVILLNPSVSPQYDLAPAAAHVRGQIHVFHSEKDTVFLGWRSRTFGSYDNIRTEAAGKVGFTSVQSLPAPLQRKIIQHPYDPNWESLGNNGGHFGSTEHDFAVQLLAPLLK